MSDNERCVWTKFSESRLIEVEKKILNVIKAPYRTWFVPIGSTVGKEDKIWTIVVNEESKNTPLVLLHGFAAGLCFWCLNYDHIAKDRPVYAIDLLGFGRSSRPDFSHDSLEAEQQMVDSLEEWRKRVNLDKFILLGHSFGGYLATSYTINHPDRVKHLVLADPWGFTEKPAQMEMSLQFKILRFLLYPLTYLNPLATVRAAGPMGPWLVNRLRRDISEKYGSAIERKELISEYIYHCNSQKPSGETAFSSMRHNVAFAKRPMIDRFHKVHQDVPVTVLYGERSWLTKLPKTAYDEARPDSKYFNVEIVKDAGHHVNADQPSLFNDVVNSICNMPDDSSYSDKILELGLEEEVQEIDTKDLDDSLDYTGDSHCPHFYQPRRKC